MEIAEGVHEVYLQPGEFCFGDGMLRISTLLGSCISIILWHPLLRHGGMCHYMLPSRKQSRGDMLPDGKFGDEAMELFMLELGKRNAAPTQYQVYVFGGGNMFDERISKGMDIGRQNIEMAHILLDKYGFIVTYDNLGNFGHRKITFNVWNGEVSLIHVDNRATGN